MAEAEVAKLMEIIFVPFPRMAEETGLAEDISAALVSEPTRTMVGIRWLFLGL